MFRSTSLSLNFLLLLLLGFAGAKSPSTSAAAAAAATTANLFNFAYPVIAFPVSTDKNNATTYLLACPSSTATSSCNFNQPFTLIQGPKTVHFAFVAPTQTFVLDCTRGGTTSLGCAATGIAPDTAKTTTEALTYTGDAAKGFFKNVRLVGERGGLMTFTPGGEGSVSLSETVKATAMVGGGVWTSGSSTGTRAMTVGGGSAAMMATTSTALVGGGPTSVSVASAKETGTETGTDSVVGNLATTTSPVMSSSSSVTGSSAPVLSTSTTSGAWKGSSNGLLVAAAVIMSVVAALGNGVL